MMHTWTSWPTTEDSPQTAVCVCVCKRESEHLEVLRECGN